MKKAYIYILVFSIFANTYSIPSIGIGYGEIVMLPLLPFLLFDFVKNGKPNKGTATVLFNCFLLFSLVVTILNMVLIPEIDEGETIKRVIRCYYYFSLFCFFSKYYFEYEIAKKAMTYFSLALAVFIILQFISYNVFGYLISGYIPGLSIDSVERNEFREKASEAIGYIRPNGFLSEPANCAHTLALALILELINYRGEAVNKIRVALYILAMLLTVSANAYAALALIGILWLWHSFEVNRKQLAKFKAILFAMVIVTMVVLSHDKIQIITDVYERFATLEESTDNSAGLRVLRGPAFWLRMEPLNQLCGIGYGNFLGYREHFHIWTIHEEPDEYMNTFSAFLVSTGVIGVILLLLCIIHSLRHKQFKNKAFMFMLLLLSMSSSIGYSPIWVLYISFSLWSYKKQKLIGLTK